MRKAPAIAVSIIIAVIIGTVVYWTWSDDVPRPLTVDAVIAHQSEPITKPIIDIRRAIPVSEEATASQSVEPVSQRSTPVKQRELLPQLRELEFRSLVQSLRLEPGDSDKLLSILQDEKRRVREWLSANQRTFISQEEMSGLRTESNQQARELLGNAKFMQYDDYREHPAERKSIDQVNEALIRNTSSPLPQELDDWLFATMKEEATRSPAPTLSGYETHLAFEVALKNWQAANKKRFLDRASSVLTPDLFALLQNASR